MKRGKYEVTLRGNGENAFLAKLASSGIKVVSLYKSGDGSCFVTDRKGISFIRKNRRGYRLRVTIERIGEESVESRLFSSGFFLVACLIPVLASLFLWKVEVDSQMPEVAERIEDKLSKASITKLRPLFMLPDEGEIRQLIMADEPELSWVRFNRSGTTLRIIPMMSPRTGEKVIKEEALSHLYARTGGVITSFRLSRGERVAHLHQTVKKGDMLATGILVQGDKTAVVGADGEVYADYWSEYNFSLPREIDMQLMGEEIVDFTWRLPWDKKKDNRITFQSPLTVKQKRMDEKSRITLTEGMEETIILPLLKNKIQLESSPSLTIKDENILHVSFDNDKVSGTILFLMNDNIAVKRPISQGD